MQTFELLLVIASATYVGLYRLINRNLQKPYVVGLLVFILLVHLVVEGTRWQMVPAYFIWLIAFITALRQPMGKYSAIVRIFSTLGLVVLLAMAIVLPSVMPVFTLPQPTGPYTVGTSDILLELDRAETITADKTDTRRLMIKAWYPSKPTDGEEDPYVDSAGRNGFASKYGLPPAMLSYLDHVETNVYRNVPIADETFPVLIFSHGYNSKANGYYALLSEVVSHGYIVFALNHTYESTGTTFPDGSETYFDYEYARQIESGTWEIIEPTIAAFKKDLSFEERHPLVREALTTYFVKDMVERWAEDIVDVGDQLAAWNASGFFQGKLDLAQVGAFGHSRGGGAAGEAVLIDSTIKAGINIDGVQWGQLVNTVFHKPFLLLTADWPAEHENLNQHAYVNKSTEVFYEGIILKSAHSNFMDIPFMVPVKSLSQAGAIDPELAMEITGRVVTTFFDRHLKGKNVDLMDLSSDYEMLEMSSYKGDSLNPD